MSPALWVLWFQDLIEPQRATPCKGFVTKRGDRMLQEVRFRYRSPTEPARLGGLTFPWVRADDTFFPGAIAQPDTGQCGC